MNVIVLFSATSLLYIGLSLTYAASAQMLRGALIIFVALLSVIFLKRRLKFHEWLGIILIIVGLAVVGLADFLSDFDSASVSQENIIIGDIAIIAGQIFFAVQVVLQERIVAGMDIPALQVVGWEGIFGFGLLGILLVPMYFIEVGPPFGDNAHGTLEDVPDALVQLWNNSQLVIAIVGTIFSIALFNFTGISVTKEMSATTRVVLDSIRTIIIWIVSLILNWQKFQWLQLAGFVIMIAGIFFYNNILRISALKK